MRWARQTTLLTASAFFPVKWVTLLTELTGPGVLRGWSSEPEAALHRCCPHRGLGCCADPSLQPLTSQRSLVSASQPWGLHPESTLAPTASPGGRSQPKSTAQLTCSRWLWEAVLSTTSHPTVELSAGGGRRGAGRRAAPTSKGSGNGDLHRFSKQWSDPDETKSVFADCVRRPSLSAHSGPLGVLELTPSRGCPSSARGAESKGIERPQMVAPSLLAFGVSLLQSPAFPRVLMLGLGVKREF